MRRRTSVAMTTLEHLPTAAVIGPVAVGGRVAEEETVGVSPEAGESYKVVFAPACYHP
jgi:hypothetical protein